MKIIAFDSGIGGLIALAPVIKNVSALELHYLGDLANLPYGTKSEARIRELTQFNLRGFLSEIKPSPSDFLVVACNTASALALDIATASAQNFGIECSGVIEPGCKMALKNTEAKRIVILATNATVNSQVYTKTLNKMGETRPILEIATPLFVPLVEEGFENTDASSFAIDFYLKDKFKDGDLVILGCTHYPLLKAELATQFRNVVAWVDAGSALMEFNFKNFETSDQKQKANIFLNFTDATASSNQTDKLLKRLGLESVKCHTKILKPYT